MKAYKMQIGIIGSAGPEEYPDQKPNRKAYRLAETVGKLVALKGAVVITGGKGGIMNAACRGAKNARGITVGVVSGNDRGTANKYVDVEVVSGMINSGEESLIISMSDGLIILGGGSGTLQEIATAYRNDKPMVVIDGLDGWGQQLAGTFLDYRQKAKIEIAETPEEAVDLLLRKLVISNSRKI